MSAATPARRWPAPDTGRSSTTICRAAIARRCAGARWSKATSHDRDRLAAAMRSHGVSARHAFRGLRLCRRVGRRPGNLLLATTSAARSRCLTRCARPAVDALVFSSTCAVYGIPEAMPIRETTPKAPLNPYGETKLAIERALALVCRRLRPALRGAALFQRRRRRSRRRDRRGPRPGNPPDPAGVARRARPRRAGRDLRHRLPDPGRHRDPRLHPCGGPGRCACPGARLSRAPAATAARSISAPAAAIRCAR